MKKARIDCSAKSYDAIYRGSRKYRLPYRESPYYPLWAASLKYISGKVIELGCGTGQFAQMFKDNLDLSYTGVDFSKEAIRQAQSRNPSMKFIRDDVFSVKISSFDTIIAFEVLEHLGDDLKLLKYLERKHKIVFSVPDYLSKNHYRCFRTQDEIYSYYQSLDIHTIEEFKLTRNKFGVLNTLFLVYGSKR